MSRTLAMVTLVVRDYDEAIAFFTRSLRFRLVEDTPLGSDKHWVVVAPPGQGGAALLLAKAATPEQRDRVGNQTGGRVFLFLETTDFHEARRDMEAAGVEFVEEPREEPYGTVAVFRDLYGNRWDLVERRPGARASE